MHKLNLHVLNVFTLTEKFYASYKLNEQGHV